MATKTAKINKTEADVEIPSGFPQYRRTMLIVFAGMALSYAATWVAFLPIRRLLDLPPSSPSLCPSPDEPCWRADLFAFEVCSGLALCWAGVTGFRAWHLQGLRESIPNTAEGRLFCYLPQAHQLTAAMTTFQVFDFFISTTIEEQRSAIMLGHHFMAALVSWYGLNNQYFHYYGVFFLGCSEISTIPLVFIDIAKFFPPIPGSYFEMFIGAVCNPLFLVAFAFYRVFLWWVVSRQMFEDIFAVLKTGKAAKFRPGRNHVLYVMMICNTLLGLLQLYWFKIILGAALDLVLV